MKPAPLPHDADDGLPPARRWRAMLTIILGISLCVLDSTMVTLALPGIVRDLQIAEADGVWLVNAYQLAILVLLLPLALLGDLLGYRRIYLAGVGLFMAASLASVLAAGPGQLALARGLQGAGAAGLFAAALLLAVVALVSALVGIWTADDRWMAQAFVLLVAAVVGAFVAVGLNL